MIKMTYAAGTVQLNADQPPHKTNKSFWQIKRILQYRFNVTQYRFEVTQYRFYVTNVLLLYLMHTNLQVIYLIPFV